MKKIFAVGYNNNLANTWLLLFRIAIGAFMLTHGYPKLLMLTAGGPVQFADPFGFGPYASLLLVVFAEFVCSILLILGLGTRIAALALAINMSVAVFYAHAADPFAKKEMAALFLVCFLSILVLGPGKYSIDNAIAGGTRSRRY